MSKIKDVEFLQQPWVFNVPWNPRCWITTLITRSEKKSKKSKKEKHASKDNNDDLDLLGLNEPEPDLAGKSADLAPKTADFDGGDDGAGIGKLATSSVQVEKRFL